ncbi:MAG: signal peptidase I [Proteobacteria bacterium]|nr:signal peptidase I [Pseudomonadota bacterium]
MDSRDRNKGTKGSWFHQVKPFLASIALVLIVRTVVAEPYRVPSGSMVPTLLIGDELLGAKFAYGFSRYSLPIGELPDFSGRLFERLPERGDVIVFRLPRDPSTTYVKRLIGLPGDRIATHEGRLYINETLVPRRAIGTYEKATLYIETLPTADGKGREHRLIEFSDHDRYDDTRTYIVPPHHYFMMGDNRDNSLDSRIDAADGGVGFVPEENLVARADLLLLSTDPDVGWFDVKHWAHTFRVDRFFARVN